MSSTKLPHVKHVSKKYIIIITNLLRHIPRRSSSVAQQNQGIKQTRNCKTMRVSSFSPEECKEGYYWLCVAV